MQVGGTHKKDDKALCGKIQRRRVSLLWSKSAMDFIIHNALSLYCCIDVFEVLEPISSAIAWYIQKPHELHTVFAANTSLKVKKKNNFFYK